MAQANALLFRRSVPMGEFRRWLPFSDLMRTLISVCRSEIDDLPRMLQCGSTYSVLTLFMSLGGVSFAAQTAQNRGCPGDLTPQSTETKNADITEVLCTHFTGGKSSVAA